MMVILGCDVYKSGMKGIGPAKMNDLIKADGAQTEDELYTRLHNQSKQRNKLAKDIVDTTFVDALLYKPSNEASNDTARSYIFGAPQSLPTYLKEFSVEDAFKSTCITEGPEIVMCKGVGGLTHLFLKSCGHKLCCKCTSIVCINCFDEIDKQAYCLACLANESIVPTVGLIASKSIAKMLEELVNDRFDGANDLSPDEVEDAHKMMNFLDQYRKRADKAVPYPLYATSEQMSSGITDKWEDILEIDFSGGEPELDSKQVPGVINFFAQLVSFQYGKKTEWKTIMQFTMPYLHYGIHQVCRQVTLRFWIPIACLMCTSCIRYKDTKAEQQDCGVHTA